MSNFVDIIKQAAMDAYAASGPMSVAFGVVEGVNPLKINVEQKMVLTSEFLILTNAVKDHYIEMTVDHKTDIATLNANHAHVASATFEGTAQTMVSNIVNPPATTVESDATTEVSGNIEVTVAGEKINLDHTHNYSGRKRFLVHNALKPGEKVLMLCVQGGQKFIVLERME